MTESATPTVLAIHPEKLISRIGRFILVGPDIRLSDCPRPLKWVITLILAAASLIDPVSYTIVLREFIR